MLERLQIAGVHLLRLPLAPDWIAAVDCSPDNPDAVENLVRAWAEPVIALRESGAEAFSLLVAGTGWDPGPEARSIIEEGL